MSEEVPGSPDYSTLSGPSDRRIELRITADHLFVDLVGEPSGADMVACFRRALDSGRLTPSMRTLVDLTEFRGTVDWAAIDAIARMAPWGRGTPGAARVAYVVRNAPFMLLIKAAWARFPLASYRVFFSRDEAMVWLADP
ncbi:MAG: hypothetical protein JO021_23270 [Alphaproteobacteria bacterium]|nr:hypothetical protein [Alphaproteobacteria bacterium]